MSATTFIVLNPLGVETGISPWWRHQIQNFPRCWPFVRGIHQFRWIPCTKGQWRGALMFSLICAWINDWVNNREAGDLRRHRGHYDVNVMQMPNSITSLLMPLLLTSPAMVLLTVHDGHTLASEKEGFKQCWEVMENTNLFYIFENKFCTVKVKLGPSLYNYSITVRDCHLHCSNTWVLFAQHWIQITQTVYMWLIIVSI